MKPSTPCWPKGGCGGATAVLKLHEIEEVGNIEPPVPSVRMRGSSGEWSDLTVLNRWAAANRLQRTVERRQFRNPGSQFDGPQGPLTRWHEFPTIRECVVELVGWVWQARRESHGRRRYPRSRANNYAGRRRDDLLHRLDSDPIGQDPSTLPLRALLRDFGQIEWPDSGKPRPGHVSVDLDALLAPYQINS